MNSLDRELLSHLTSTKSTFMQLEKKVQEKQHKLPVGHKEDHEHEQGSPTSVSAVVSGQHVSSVPSESTPIAIPIKSPSCKSCQEQRLVSSSDLTLNLENGAVSGTSPGSFRRASMMTGEALQRHLRSLSDVDMPKEYMNSMLEQSPIDICEMESEKAEKLDIEVNLSQMDAEIVHLGNNFQVNWQSADRNYIKIDEKVFQTVQFHFHTPSEHTINGHQMPMELHLVHQAADGNLAVIAIFFEEGEENDFLSQFWHELPNMDPQNRNRLSIGMIHPEFLHMLCGNFFRYRGSLTTPPYTEGVEWIIVRDIAYASREQIEIFRRALPSPNARPIQPRNHRVVFRG